MNTNAIGQISNPPITILRQPPAVPVSAPITKPLPALPKSSPEKSKEDTTPSEPPPPQPPVRTRVSTLKAQPNGNDNIVPNNNNGNENRPSSLTNNKNQLTDASNEVAKLVYKTVMMGSVQNVSEIVDNEKSPSRKKSVVFNIL